MPVLSDAILYPEESYVVTVNVLVVAVVLGFLSPPIVTVNAVVGVVYAELKIPGKVTVGGVPVDVHELLVVVEDMVPEQEPGRVISLFLFHNITSMLVNQVTLLINSVTLLVYQVTCPVLLKNDEIASVISIEVSEDIIDVEPLLV